MKKLIIKDKIIRYFLKNFSKNYFVLKSIIKNKHFFLFIRFNAYLKLNQLTKKNYLVVNICNRCIKTVNKKSFNKFTFFSRFLYLKLLRSGKIVGFQKLS